MRLFDDLPSYARVARKHGVERTTSVDGVSLDVQRKSGGVGNFATPALAESRWADV